MSSPLAEVKIRGFRSVAAVDLALSSNVTLLIGANGSGKSNIVDAFELLGFTVDRKLQNYVLQSGGFNDLLHRGRPDSPVHQVSVEAWGDWQVQATGSVVRNGYRMQITAGHDDTAVLDETTFLHGEGYSSPYNRPLGQHRESVLADSVKEHLANQYLHSVLTGCRVFHFDDTSSDAPPFRRVDVADSESLHSDARNLAAVLLDAKLHHRAEYDRIVRSVKVVAPFFEDFVLEPRGDTVNLRWQEAGIDGTFSGSALSSGTIRFICLATLLQQPNPPATIVLDEPELGLHPAAIRHLTELMSMPVDNRRIVAATQSVSLLSNFSLEEIAVVERVAGTTTVERPDLETLTGWLDDYSLGDLWEMNLLGGRPRPAASTRRTW